MYRVPPLSTRPDPRFPSPSLFRSFITDLDAAITRIASEEAIKGGVIASGKDSGFMAGMDLKFLGAMLASAEGARPAPADIFDKVFVLNQLRSEEHTSELQSLMRNSYAVFCVKKKK